ncbi:cytidylate kinase family protein [Trichloromonas sp.]|uniref:cytidylate kinase family protein n=1 Tax=Trichloromonas sp. TaxID=3069249 RepID=UPI002A3AB2AD|nr:cytidylate kinase family protein [Trichloromonas sp.]
MAIITISREMGSAGIPIAHKAADKLGYTLVDGDAIRKVAANYGLSVEALENADEKPPAFVETVDSQTEANFHRIQLIILEYALKGNVIIYGRGGQDLLKGINSVLRVRIIAPFDERVERWAEREWLDPDLARVLVRKSDQQRAGFIKYYFDRDWNDPLAYDLIINTLNLSEETAVKLICDAIKDRNLTERKDHCKKNLKDLIIRKKIETELFARGTICGLHQYHFHVAAKDGEVTLEGYLHSREDLKTVLDVIASIDGIKSVTNNLELRQYQSNPREH